MRKRKKGRHETPLDFDGWPTLAALGDSFEAAIFTHYPNRTIQRARALGFVIEVTVLPPSYLPFRFVLVTHRAPD